MIAQASMFITSLVLVSATMAQTVQTNALESLKCVYDAASTAITVDNYKQRDFALEGYGRSLDVIMQNLKKKGDIDGWGVIDAELKRFQVEKTVAANECTPEVAKAVAAFEKQVKDVDTEAVRRQSSLLNNYVKALNKMEDARVAGDARKNAESLLAEFDRQLPKLPKSKIPELYQVSKKSVPKGAVAYKGHHYLFITAAVTWAEARRESEKLGGHLVTISDAQESDFVNTVAKERGCWIGLTSQGWMIRHFNHPRKTVNDFRWIDNTPFKFSAWLPGDPNGGDKENDGGIWYYRHGDNNRELTWGWIDASDNFKKLIGYICEWEY